MGAKKKVTATGVDTGLFPTMVRPGTGPQEQGEDEEPRDRFCYLFNDALTSDHDDRKCRSCKKYLTTLCDQIEHFIDEDGDVEE